MRKTNLQISRRERQNPGEEIERGKGSDRHRSSRERERDVHYKLITQRVLGFNVREREREGGGGWEFLLHN
jgi:hypothetical protein